MTSEDEQERGAGGVAFALWLTAPVLLAIAAAILTVAVILSRL